MIASKISKLHLEKEKPGHLCKLYTRINPIGFQKDLIYIDTDLNEIFLEKEANINDGNDQESWILDGFLDPILGLECEESSTFCTQEQLWEKVLGWYIPRFLSNVASVSIVTLGTQGSGKSYSLFGKPCARERGVVPRWMEMIFDSTCPVNAIMVQLTMLLAANEIVYDLFEVIVTA